MILANNDNLLTMNKPFIAALCTAFLCFQLHSQPREVLLDSLFTVLHERGQFNGNALVVMGGQRMHLGSYGYADREAKRELSETSIFNTGNISMVFTAVAILQLEENDLLNIDDPVIDHLPGFIYKNITVRQLLNHTSGLSDHPDYLASLKPTEVAGNDILVAEFYNKSPDLKFKPGMKYSFSEMDYIFLAEIIEAVSGDTYAEFLEDNIFKPAEMTNTFVLDINESLIHKNIALGYFYDIGTNSYIQNIRPEENSFLYHSSGLTGSGNIYSSVRDLYKFCQSIKERKIITSGSFKKLSGKEITSGNDTYSGLGWTILDNDKDLCLYTEGRLPGYRTGIFWNFGKNHVIVILSNDYRDNLSYFEPIFHATTTLVEEEKFYIPKIDAGIEISSLVYLNSRSELKDKLEKMNGLPEVYYFNDNSINFLVNTLTEEGDEKNARMIEKLFEKELKRR